MENICRMVVGIVGVAFFVIVLVLWKGGHIYHISEMLDTVKNHSASREHITSTPLPEEFPVVRFEDFVPKKCGDAPTRDSSVKWNVFIQTGRFYRRCVGTLISRSFVLTSGHCVEGIKPDEITMFLGRVHMGALPLCLDTSRCQKVVAERVWENKFHNVALIKTRLPVTESEEIQPICLPLNVTVEDTRQDNEEVIYPRIPIGSDQMEIACGNWGVPSVVKDKEQRYNIVGLAYRGCNPTMENDVTPFIEYAAWVISILPNGEKELIQSTKQAGSSAGKVLQHPAS